MACSGNGVKITENVFKEKEYKACNVCESKGYTTCTVCKGLKIENLPCNTCKGSGALATNQVCTHPTEDSAAELPGL
jgi:transcription elongation factor Elf1